MGVSNRTSKVSSFIAALCIFIYIAAIAYGAAQIIVNIGERRNVAREEFNDLADRASSSAVFLGFMSQAYQETIRDFIGSSKTLLGVIISGSNGEYAFERYQGSGIVWTGDSPRFKISAGLSGEPFVLPLRIEGQRNVNIQAIYSYLDYNLSLRVLRNVLLAILAGLTIAFITLLVEIGQKNKNAYYRLAVPGVKSARKPGVRPDILPAIKPDAEPVQKTLQPVNSTEKKPASEASKANSQKTENPQGLFTPRGNVGWKSYLKDRLDSELQRCASLEHDLVFLIIEFKGSEEISDSLYRQFADEVVDFFTLRDLIFENGERGISIILPNVDLDMGITKAEDFRARIASKLPESFEGRSELCAGLSSRSGRIMDAERLMLEATKALEKALEDPVSPIVAFKSDPEKYREYIKTLSSKG